MCVCAEQTAVDLLCHSCGYYLAIAICYSLQCQVQHCSSDIINTFVLHTGVTVNTWDLRLPDLYPGQHPPHRSAVQIHFDMPPTASVDIIKRRHLLGKTFRQTYLRTDLIAGLCSILFALLICTFFLIGICNSVNCPELLCSSLCFSPVPSLCPHLCSLSFILSFSTKDQLCIAMRPGSLATEVTSSRQSAHTPPLTLLCQGHTTASYTSLPANVNDLIGGVHLILSVFSNLCVRPKFVF